MLSHAQLEAISEVLERRSHCAIMQMRKKLPPSCGSTLTPISLHPHSLECCHGHTHAFDVVTGSLPKLGATTCVRGRVRGAVVTALLIPYFMTPQL